MIEPWQLFTFIVLAGIAGTLLGIGLFADWHDKLYKKHGHCPCDDDMREEAVENLQEAERILRMKAREP